MVVLGPWSGSRVVDLFVEDSEAQRDELCPWDVCLELEMQSPWVGSHAGSPRCAGVSVCIFSCLIQGFRSWKN